MSDNNLLSQALQKKDEAAVGSGNISAYYSGLNRQAAAEGIVMLKNDGVLPIKGVMSVFGRVQNDYFYVGNGSGGDVRAPYKVSLMQGIENNPKLTYNKELADIYANWCAANPAITNAPWGAWPTSHPEMPLDKQTVQAAKNVSDIAVVILGRCAGEDRDSALTDGSFFLTKAEEMMLDVVTETFDKIVLLINSGNIIDFSWYEKYECKISAMLYVWQGGMESGNAVCDVLAGDHNPSGKLPTAIAHKYEDYPSAGNFAGKDFNIYQEDIFVGYRYFETFAKEKALFPFGYGLSYTNFDIQAEVTKNDDVSLNVKVKNIGNVDGAEVVQVYYSAPQGVLGKPLRELAAFKKTAILKPDEAQNLNIEFPLYYMASYDDAGKTGHKSAYVLEAGEYDIYVGSCVRSARKVGGININELTMCIQHEEAAAVPAESKFQRFTAISTPTGIEKVMEDVPTRTVDLKERILAGMPTEITPAEYKGYKLQDVQSGKISLEEFVGGLNITELEALTRGDYVMGSSLGVPGNAGTYGGVIESLREKGVQPVTTSDGPSGIRLMQQCALIPCGLTLSSTWNVDLLEALATEQGKELAEKGSHILLAPGMNILRDPLCGRNFEYYSEDPVLSGKMAASMVKGLQKRGKSACPKHYAANNQEQYRSINDSRVSERALREIYLRGFEICVKESKPRNLMTSYNKINGVWAHYHYELCATILRGEWGYEGIIITDWWMKPCQDPDFPDVFNDGYRVRAQVDVLMPGGKVHFATEGDGSLIASYNKDNGISLAEIQRSAMHTLKFVMHVHN